MLRSYHQWKFGARVAILVFRQVKHVRVPEHSYSITTVFPALLFAFTISPAVSIGIHCWGSDFRFKFSFKSKLTENSSNVVKVVNFLKSDNVRLLFQNKRNKTLDTSRYGVSL